MTVYVLFHETNTGRGDESDGYVEGVYATKEAAEAEQVRLQREAWADGRGWCNPDDEDDENVEWSDDWHVESHDVQP